MTDIKRKPVQIFALGEAMVEFNQTGDPPGRLYLQGFGGDTSNFAIAAARQGARSGCLGALGADLYGAMLRRLWDVEGVDHRHVLTDADAYTAIYFVTHDERGHHFNFFRKGSAASQVTPVDLPVAAIRQAKVLHVSGISLAVSLQARETCFEAMRIAREAGVKVSFDTNLRLKLWSLDEARNVIRQAIALSDICLPSLEDMASLTGCSDPQAIARECLDLGAGLVVLKLGSEGALLASGQGFVNIPPWPCSPLDATGAGDTFGGAFVARLLAGDTPLDAAHYAAVAAALSTQGYGAVEPIPHAAQVFAAMGTKPV